MSQSRGSGCKHLLAMIVAAAAPVLGLLPFLAKAYHIDDPVYVRVAQQIAAEPGDFYGFSMNWYGTAMPVHDFNQNPPGASYYLALPGALFGWEERVLHAAMLLPFAALGLGVYLLARGVTAHPLLAALIATYTPGALVSATNVMSDVLMLAFYVWAVVLWLAASPGRETVGEKPAESKHLVLLAAVGCATAAAMTKYFGITVVALLAAHTIAVERRAPARLLYLLIPLGALALYEFYTSVHYGHSLFSTAASYAASYGQGADRQSLLGMTFAGLSFAGGCLLTTACFAPMLWSRSTLVWSVLLLAVCCAIPLVSEGFIAPAAREVTKLSIVSVGLAGVFIAAGIHVFALMVRDIRNHRDATSLLLFLWITGTFAFAVYLNWTVNARVLLPMAPPAAILVARRLDYVQARWPMRPLPLAWPLGAGAVCSLWVALGDYQFAEASRRAASHFEEKFAESESPVYFQGHWGFQYYMEEAGFIPVDFAPARLYPGDLMIIPSNNTNIQHLDPSIVTVAEHVLIPLAGGVTTVNIERGAGFYSNGYGPLPFVIGATPPQLFTVYTIQ